MPVSSFYFGRVYYSGAVCGYTAILGAMILPIRLATRLLGVVTLRGALTGIALLTWALWLGATIAVFVFVKHFFAVFPHEVAGTAVNAMFNSFARYEMALAGALLLSSGLLLVCYPSVRWILVLGCVVLTAGMAVTVGLGLIPMMDALIEQGRQHSPAFIKLHVKSMIAMTMQTGMLLVTGTVLLVKSNKLEAGEEKSGVRPRFKGRNGRMFVDG
jgi:hypothetical protein